MQIAGSVVIVTGASAGIGAATARALAQRGANVVLSARRAERLTGLVAELANYPGQRLALPGDVQDESYCRQLIAEAVAAFGRLDVLINNAGLGHRSRISQIDSASLHAILHTNLLGPLYLTQVALPQLQAQGRGQIINISNIVSRRPFVDNGVYAASKAALDIISRTLRLELAGSGVVVTVVYPGMTVTDFHASFPDRPGRSNFGWMGISPEWVARAIVRAIERERREVFITPWDWAIVHFSRLWPRTTDWIAARMGRAW